MSGIDACLREAMALPGARGAALVEWVSGLALGHAGEAPDGDHEAMAAQTAEFARAAAEHPVFAGPHTGAAAAKPAGTPADAPTSALAKTQVGTPTRAQAGTPGGPPVEDVVVATRTCYHLLRYVEAPYDGGVFLHLWLDRADANLALALLRLRDLAARLVLA